METPPKLTARQEQFCLEWVTDRNGKQAAIRSGYSPQTAKQQASRLLTNVNVKRRIRQLQKGQAKRLQITSDRVMNEYAKLAFSDIGDVARWTDKGVEFIPSKHMRKSARQTISEISSETKRFTTDDGVSETTTLKVKLYPKLPALDKLALHLGISTGDTETDDPQEADTTHAVVQSTFGRPETDPME